MLEPVSRVRTDATVPDPKGSRGKALSGKQRERDLCRSKNLDG
jgi:hypothetical protein